jgi:hypothetical protein
MSTFLFAGLAMHDLPAWIVTRRLLPPGGTIAFTFFAVGLLASERAGMDLSARPAWLRASVNAAYLASCTGLMLVVCRRLARR